MSKPLEHILDTLTEYKTNALKIAALTEEQKTLRARIEDELGDDDTGTLLGVPVVTWKYSKPRTTFDQAAFKRDHPELAGAYMKTGQAVRSFKVVS